MATLHKHIVIAAPRELIWDAIRDIGALHTRLVPGFVTNTRLDGVDARIVTFANGQILREPILSLDDERFRIAWAAEGGAATHYNAVIELVAVPGGTRVVWTTDFLPHELAPSIDAMQDHALAAMKRAMEAEAARRALRYVELPH